MRATALICVGLAQALAFQAITFAQCLGDQDPPCQCVGTPGEERIDECHSTGPCPDPNDQCNPVDTNQNDVPDACRCPADCRANCKNGDSGQRTARDEQDCHDKCGEICAIDGIPRNDKVLSCFFEEDHNVKGRCEVLCKGESQEPYQQILDKPDEDFCHQVCDSYCGSNENVRLCTFKNEPPIKRNFPTLPEWGLIGLVVVLAIGGVIIVARRRAGVGQG